ncbi:acyl-CoA dehydrogenase family protein [Nocardia aurantia]|uniref:Acyl-CoA dehydrogenase FadE27 n=1 Tax=Nocardia aurantia TaxID=2585199 RepID=A0A7K0DFQ4_9NOCA|nr:acyl-CoA dehydrogenase family protein [Nocardia aurantia]MQY24625.1 Acyl-CoA dehydrogenase FadE27 [Nocardia aurantia]
MDFTQTEAQQDLTRLTGEVCGKLVTADRLRELDHAPARFDEPLWRSLAETGVLASALPESLGGSDFGVLEQTAILRELGRHVAAVPYLWSIALGAAALARFGSPAQTELAAKAAAGETILTVALAEERNWDPARPTTLAVADAGHWLLTGTKTAVPFAAHASRILVPASVSGTSGTGTALFLVDPGAPGVRAAEQQVVDKTPESELEFDSAPAELVGTLDSGALAWLLDRAWLGLAAQQLGTVERALELVADYAREREQFGRKIGSFQAVAQRLADGYIDVQGLRLAVTQAAWRLSEDLDATAEIHTAKFWAADAGHRVAHTAVHVHGGVGIDRDHIVHNYFIAAKHNEFALGGATDHLRALGALLARD